MKRPQAQVSHPHSTRLADFHGAKRERAVMERRTGDLAGDSECVVERPGYLQGYLDRRPSREIPAELDQIGHGDSVRRIASNPEGAIRPPPSADGNDRSVAEQRSLGQRSFKVGD